MNKNSPTVVIISEGFVLLLKDEVVYKKNTFSYIVCFLFVSIFLFIFKFLYIDMLIQFWN